MFDIFWDRDFWHFLIESAKKNIENNVQTTQEKRKQKHRQTKRCKKSFRVRVLQKNKKKKF